MWLCVQCQRITLIVDAGSRGGRGGGGVFGGMKKMRYADVKSVQNSEMKIWVIVCLYRHSFWVFYCGELELGSG